MSHNSLMRLVLFAIMSFYAVGSADAQTSSEDADFLTTIARHDYLKNSIDDHKRNKSLISHSSPLALRSIRSAWRPER